MTTQTTPYIERYAAQFRASAEDRSLNGSGWLHALRTEALDRFEALGFPTARRGNEAWKYTSVAPIARGAFEDGFEARGLVTAAALRRLIPSDAGWTRLVFVNGRFAPELSTEGIPNGSQAGSLARAASAQRQIVEPHLARYAAPGSDGFAALNTAFLRDGAFIHAGSGDGLDRPIHLVYVAAGTGAPAVSYPRTLIVAGPHSKVTIVESYVSAGGAPHFTNAVTEIAIDDGASVEHYRLLAEGPQSFHVGTTQVRQGKDSSYRSLAAARGAALARHTLSVLLDAPGARCELNGLYATAGTEHADNSTMIDHARPRTTSRQYYKGILDGESRAVFMGKVVVRPGAQKADADQKNRNLLLSRGAEIDSKPTLEIFADDVRCTHGATAGQLDPTTLFYLMSRGLDDAAARRLLIRAFAGEIVQRANLKPLRGELERRIASTPAGSLA
jgi:Fe-S cluster assembly protein SufD